MLSLVVSPFAVPVPSSDSATTLLQASKASTGTLPGIVPAAAVACAYRNSNLVTVLGLLAGNLSATCGAVWKEGWELTESYNIVQEGTGDTDNLDVHTKDGDCLMAMHGDDMSEAGFSGYNCTTCTNGSMFAPLTYNGVDGVMGQIADETETLLNAIRTRHGSLASWTAAMCPGKLYLAGHSSGGGIAALIGYLANLASDPLGMNKHVDEIYTYSTGTYFQTSLANPRSADGCFKGMAYYTRVPEGIDSGYGSYGDPTAVQLFSGYGYKYLVPLPYMSLDVIGSATSPDNVRGPVTSTPCGSQPWVYTSMSMNTTLLDRASAQKIIAFGASFGLHEPIAVYNSFQ